MNVLKALTSLYFYYKTLCFRGSVFLYCNAAVDENIVAGEWDTPAVYTRINIIVYTPSLQTKKFVFSLRIGGTGIPYDQTYFCTFLKH